MSTYNPAIYIRDYVVADERIFVLHGETVSKGEEVAVRRSFRVPVRGPNSGVLLLEPGGGSLLISGQGGARLRFSRLGQTVSRTRNVRILWNYVRVLPGRTVSDGKAVRVGRVLRIDVQPASSVSNQKAVQVSRSFRVVSNLVGTRSVPHAVPVHRHFAVPATTAHSVSATAQAYVRLKRRLAVVSASTRSQGKLTPVQRVFSIAIEKTSTASSGHTVQVIFGATSDPALKLSGTAAGPSNTGRLKLSGPLETGVLILSPRPT